MKSKIFNRHERAAFQRSAFRRSTTGNDVVATIILSLFLYPPPPFFSPAFPPSRPFLIEDVLRLKNFCSESCLECPKTHFQTPSAILGPPGSHIGFCRRWGVAGSEWVPPSPLGWYLFWFSPKMSIFQKLLRATILKVEGCAFGFWSFPSKTRSQKIMKISPNSHMTRGNRSVPPDPFGLWNGLIVNINK